MQKLLINTINLYQKTLSPDHGPLAHRHPYGYCRYYPSCSEYAKIAIAEHGTLHGVGLASWRIIRCNPWSQPRVDLSCHKTHTTNISGAARV